MKTNFGKAGEGQSVWVAGDRYTIKATGEDTGGAFSLVEAEVPPGGGPPPHQHGREDEAFYVIEGEVEFQADGKRSVAGPGCWITLAKGSVHSFKNLSQVTAKMLIFLTPAGFEQYFLEVGRPASPEDTVPIIPTHEDIERMLALAPKYGIEMFLSEK
ncbi:cupin domain-containing protein [Singulisphaera sp. PoT]|uniref:cupin domain-containing protein n=1 Tax=Singulisphaera sp. PoT TaxID=3411797 RepID=UPI003BF52012